MKHVYRPWKAWQLTHVTVGWAVWIAFFIGWETYALWRHRGQELTAHLRPMFQEHPLMWWLTFGLWKWLGWHFLVEGVLVKPGWPFNRRHWRG